MGDALFDSLFAALEAAPDQLDLRLQVARLLLDRGRAQEAAEQAGVALQQQPTNAEALALLSEAGDSLRTPPATQASAEGVDAPADGFDWSQAEQDVGTGTGKGSGADIPPPFVSGDPDVITPGSDDVDPVIDISKEVVTLDDVGGLDLVKKRLRESFLEPMKNPELAKAFGKTLRGGLLLYGPPGCGKTYMARAIAGELGASFLTASIADVMGTHFGETEKNLKALFDRARDHAPAVLFLDEIDALGARRSSIGTGWSGMRAIVNQLLMELDSMSGDNDGLFVLAATNAPWEVDNALLRPGRFDRMLLVLPPDVPAREAILRHHFERRPIAGIDLGKIVKLTDQFSGADLEHVVATAAEKAMIRSLAAGSIDPIGMADVHAALTEIKPSTGSWMQGAKNVVTFSNADGRYDELGEHLKAIGIL
jgi:AAA+ superfamily predicted ATPase